MAKASKKQKRRLYIIIILILALMVILPLSVYDDIKRYTSEKTGMENYYQEYQNLLDEEERLKQEITKLQDSSYLARYAKEKYMLSSDGDTIIKMD